MCNSLNEIVKLKLLKQCIYLDQFAVSEMAIPTSKIWKDIRQKIIQLHSENLIFCPISLEHFIETAGKDFEHFKELHNFLYAISSGYFIKPEIFITSQLISSQIRNNNITHKTFLDENYPILENLEDKYEKLKQTKSGYNEMFTEGLSDLNLFRNMQGTQRLENKMKEDFLNANLQISSTNFVSRLKELQQDNKISIRGNNFGGHEMPNWLDQIIYQLLTKHKFSRNEIDKLITEFERNGFNNISVLDIRFKINSLLSVYNKKEIPSDHIDIGRICTALPISTILLTDKKRKYEILELQLDKKYSTKIFSGTQEDLNDFLTELNLIT